MTNNSARRSTAAASCLRVLRATAEHPNGVGVSELARDLDLGKSSVHTFLMTLADQGFVERSPDGTYRLGMTAFEVGSATPETARLGGPVLGPLRRLADNSGESATLAVVSGHDALMVQRFETEHILRVEIHVGTRMPLTSCASGKLLLAYMSDDEVDALLPTDRLPSVTPRSIRSKAALRKLFPDIRERGWAGNDEEFAEGITGVAAPVRNRRNEVVAALSLAGPTTRFDPKRWIPDILRAADDATEAMRSRL